MRAPAGTGESAHLQPPSLPNLEPVGASPLLLLRNTRLLHSWLRPSLQQQPRTGLAAFPRPPLKEPEAISDQQTALHSSLSVAIRMGFLEPPRPGPPRLSSFHSGTAYSLTLSMHGHSLPSRCSQLLPLPGTAPSSPPPLPTWQVAHCLSDSLMPITPG